MNMLQNKRTAILLAVFVLIGTAVQAQLVVSSVGVITKEQAYSEGGPAAFGQQVAIVVSGTDTTLRDLRKAVIYINGFKMPCYHPGLRCAPGVAAPPVADTAKATDTAKKKQAIAPTARACDTLVFTLTKDSAAAWDKWYGFGNSQIAVTIDIGTASKMLTGNTGSPLTINTYQGAMIWVCGIVAVLLLIGLLVVAFFSDSMLLKDTSVIKDKKPYSLARFQLFWWTLIVTICFILLFGLRDHLDLFNATSLLLLGITASSTGLSFLIDYSDSGKDRHQNQAGKNFFIDVISDEQGVSIHRLQNLVFSLLFGIIFIYKVFETGSMPVFGQTELFLMGISSAAYLALKSGENKNAGPAPNPPGGGTAGTTPAG